MIAPLMMCNGMMGYAMMSGGMMSNGMMGAGMYGGMTMALMWLPATLTLMVGILIALVIFGKK